MYICPCVSSAAARLVRDYKRIQVPFQLEIMRGVTTLGKETYIDAIWTSVKILDFSEIPSAKFPFSFFDLTLDWDFAFGLSIDEEW